MQYLQLEEIRDALDKHGVEYLLIGKGAAIIHGFADTTQDADLYIRKNQGNQKALMRALESLGFELKVENKEEIEEGKDFIQLKEGPFDIDLIFAPDGIEHFEDAWIRGRNIQGFYVCSIDDIIASKQSAGRIKDRETLPRLKSFREYMKERGARPGERLPPLKPEPTRRKEQK